MPRRLFTIPRHKLMTQTVVWFLLISLLPLGVATYLTFWYAKQTMHKDMLQGLHAMAQRQANELKTFIWGAEDSVALLASNPNVIEALTYLQKDQSTGVNRSNVLKLFDPVFNDMLIDHAFKSLLLVDPSGDILYGVGKYSKLEDNLLDSQWRRTALGVMLEHTLMTMGQQVSDFRPMKEGGRPELFIACPVIWNKRLLGVVIVQLHEDLIFKRISNYAGLGTTGETIISKNIGDGIMILNPTRHQAPSSSLFSESKDSEKVRVLSRSLSGHNGTGQAIDYRGEPIWAAWEYIPEYRWGLIVKKDLKEADMPIVHLKRLALSVAASTFIIVFVLAVFAAQTITQPIVQLTRIAERIARGNLTIEAFKDVPRNEIGVLSRALVLMASNLKLLVNQVKDSSAQVVTINRDIAQASQRQSDAVTQTILASDQIKLSSKEISTTAAALSGMMEDVNKTVRETAAQAKSGLDSLTMMEANMKELAEEKKLVSEQLSVIKEKTVVVNSIITTMTKVADQTNLLSLNAAIQVKQAGESGRGFSVVAVKIRELADQAATSTLEIERMVQDMQMAVQRGVKSMGQFSNRMSQNLEEISSLSHYLARVIVEVQALPNCFERVLNEMQFQSKNAHQIKYAIGKMSENVEYTASVLEDSRNTLDRLQSSSDMLQKEVARFMT